MEAQTLANITMLRIAAFLKGRGFAIGSLEEKYIRMCVSQALDVAPLVEREILIKWADGEMTEGVAAMWLGVSRLEAREMAKLAGLHIANEIPPHLSEQEQS